MSEWGSPLSLTRSLPDSGLSLHRMGHAYNESYVEFKVKKRSNFCNKLFTAWDFNITDPNTAKLKRIHIRTDFEVRLATANPVMGEKIPLPVLDSVSIR